MDTVLIILAEVTFSIKMGVRAKVERATARDYGRGS